MEDSKFPPDEPPTFPLFRTTATSNRQGSYNLILLLIRRPFHAYLPLSLLHLFHIRSYQKGLGMISTAESEKKKKKKPLPNTNIQPGIQQSLLVW